MKYLRWFLIAWFFISCESDEKPAWLPVSTPEEEGLETAVLSELSQRIRNGDYGEVHSLLIIRHDKLVFEEYYRGYGPSAIHPVYSVTKSVTSALIGIAWDQGRLATDQTLLSFFPQYPDIQNKTAGKDSIRLADVLTMRTGLDWNELSISYFDPTNHFHQMTVSSDWYKFVLDRPMAYAPGTHFTYNSGASVLLSGVLEKATGQTAETFAQATLFKTLGITDYTWSHGANGITNTGAGLSLLPRDMAKIGYLYLHQGVWEGVQVISQAWVDTSTALRVTLSGTYGYGFQWWMCSADSLKNHTPAREDIKIAWGFADQFIFVVPELDMVVVSTAGNYDESRDDKAVVFLQQYILKAVKN